MNRCGRREFAQFIPATNMQSDDSQNTINIGLGDCLRSPNQFRLIGANRSSGDPLDAGQRRIARILLNIRYRYRHEREAAVPHYHAIVRLDHSQARVFSFNPDEVDEMRVLSHPPHRQMHHKAGTIGSGKSEEDHAFFHTITAALDQAGEVLVVGPGAAKLHFIRYLHRYDPALEPKLVGVETVDHPTDRQVVAYARKYFRAADRMRP